MIIVGYGYADCLLGGAIVALKEKEEGRGTELRFSSMNGLAGVLAGVLLQEKRPGVIYLVGIGLGRNSRLLAEKIDSIEQADFCRTLGFELFQGYYFAKPTVLSVKRANPAQLALLELLDLVLADADTAEIERVFKQNANLTYNLLRLVNSAGGGAVRRIETVSQAIMLLGRKQLQRWLQLLVFTLQEGTPYPSPLLLMAAARGRMMELLAQRRGGDAALRDQAFMAGIFSLIENVIGKPLAEILQDLNLGETMNAALLRREGTLGALLDLVESVEQQDLGHTLTLLDAAGGLSLSDLTVAEIEAMVWTHQIADESNHA